MRDIILSPDADIELLEIWNLYAKIVWLKPTGW
jgi:hypothetical protein